MSATLDPRSGDRLDGWKEIARYLGRGVRTVQRWEEELGLPVKRQFTGTAQTVFAYKRELDAWRDEHTFVAGEDGAEVPRPSAAIASTPGRAPAAADAARPRRPIRAKLGLSLVVTGVMAGAAFATWHYLGPRLNRTRESAGAGSVPTAPNPVAVVGSGNVLTALGPSGEVVWRRPFDDPLTEASSEAGWRNATLLIDLDGDGVNEVVFARQSSTDPTVYVVGPDGGLRLSHRIERSARFGDTVFGPPWPASRVFPLSGGRSFAVAYHVRDQFPAVVQEFNARMEVVGEFWSSGYVSWYSGVTVGQRTLTLVGASYNQTSGASLAIFDGSVVGSAPATRTKYRCGDCPDGRPLTFLVFPRSRLQLDQGANSSVLSVNPLSPTEYSVRVEQGRASDGTTASAYYRIDERGRILDAEMGAEFQALQLAIEREGKTTAATRHRGLADLLPVLRWTGDRFERVAQLER